MRYSSIAGDMVDEIAWRYYGARDAGTLAAVFAANPGLADYPARLPHGVVITLPDIAPPAPAEGVKLWT